MWGSELERDDFNFYKCEISILYVAAPAEEYISRHLIQYFGAYTFYHDFLSR